MNFANLRAFLTKSAESKNPVIKKRADDMLEQMMANQEQEQVPVPEFQEETPDAAIKNQTKDQVDALLLPAFPELAQPEGIDSTFGKAASAYVADVAVKDLPKATRETIYKFIPSVSPRSNAVQYGMVVDELLPKVDHHNYEAAYEHIKQDLADKGKRVLGDRFQEKVKDKYVLTLNDCIVDGHHFLALAQVLGLTCSLRVLDLTPIRFQEKRGSLISLIKKSQYGKSNDSRKGGITVPRHSRGTPVFRRKGTR